MASTNLSTYAESKALRLFRSFWSDCELPSSPPAWLQRNCVESAQQQHKLLDLHLLTTLVRIRCGPRERASIETLRHDPGARLVVHEDLQARAMLVAEDEGVTLHRLGAEPLAHDASERVEGLPHVGRSKDEVDAA